MSLAGLLLCWSALIGGGDPDESSELPAGLAAELPQQQGLDGAPVEKAPKQDDFGRPPQQDDDSLLINFGAHARFSVPFGAADRSYSSYYNYYVVDHYLSWADFFNPGWGYEFEADIFFNKNAPGHRRTRGFNYGLVLLFTEDQYHGRSVDDDFAGNLKVEDMTTATLQIGGKVMQTLGNDFYYGGLITLGVVHYSAVEGTFSAPGLPTVRDEVFRDTYTFASTFRADGGYRLGPIGITLGIGLRLLAPPTEGGRISMNSGAFWTFDVDLGA